jgi:hypothetical protein
MVKKLIPYRIKNYQNKNNELPIPPGSLVKAYAILGVFTCFIHS